MMADSPEPSLNGLRVLVVEDVAILAWRVRDVLEGAGANVVGPAPSVAGALALLAGQGVDAAVLDKNLDGSSSDPIADVLVAQDVPFLFLTGYGSDDDGGRYGERPTMGKPVKPRALVELLATLVHGHRPTGQQP